MKKSNFLNSAHYISILLRMKYRSILEKYKVKMDAKKEDMFEFLVKEGKMRELKYFLSHIKPTSTLAENLRNKKIAHKILKGKEESVEVRCAYSYCKTDEDIFMLADFGYKNSTDILIDRERTENWYIDRKYDVLRSLIEKKILSSHEYQVSYFFERALKPIFNPKRNTGIEEVEKDKSFLLFLCEQNALKYNKLGLHPFADLSLTEIDQWWPLLVEQKVNLYLEEEEDFQYCSLSKITDTNTEGAYYLFTLWLNEFATTKENLERLYKPLSDNQSAIKNDWYIKEIDKRIRQMEKEELEQMVVVPRSSPIVSASFKI